MENIGFEEESEYAEQKFVSSGIIWIRCKPLACYASRVLLKSKIIESSKFYSTYSICNFVYI